MAFMKKIEKPISQEIDIEKEREKFISNAERKEPKEKKYQWVKMLLRVRDDFVKHIDEQIKDKIGATRTSWILEAIQEKMRRENKRKEND